MDAGLLSIALGAEASSCVTLLLVCHVGLVYHPQELVGSKVASVVALNLESRSCGLPHV